MAKKTNTSWDSEDNVVQSNWVKFNSPLEDKIMGTLIAIREVKSTMVGKEGELVKIYELKADEGTFHNVDDRKKLIEEPVVIEAGTFWSIGGKPLIDRQMQNVKLGQKVGFKYTEDLPSKTKGFAPAKMIKVYTPKNDDGSFQMDTEWIEANKTDAF